MPATTGLGFPYPVPGDAPNVPSDIQALAANLNAFHVGLRPVYTQQASGPNFATTSAWVNFTNTEWPALTFNVPASGMFFASVAADMTNTNTGTSTVHVSFTVTSGTATIIGDADLSTQGTRLYGTKRVLCTATPTASLTLTPEWNISSGNATTAAIASGVLLVEPIA